MKKNYLPEIEVIRSWSLMACDFISNKIPDLRDMMLDAINIYEKFPMNGKRSELQGLKEGMREIKGIAKGLSLVDYDYLNALLLEKFGIGLEDNNKEIIKHILKRNKIINETEYRIIYEWVYENDMDIEQVKQFDKLLFDYTESLDRH